MLNSISNHPSFYYLKFKNPFTANTVKSFLAFNAISCLTPNPKAIKEAKKGNIDFFKKQPHDALEAKNTKGGTPLMIASKYRNSKLVTYLIEKKANISEQDHEGNTALHYATKQNSAIIVKLLLEQKSNPAWQNKKGETALHIAVKENNGTVETLIRSKADIHIQNKDHKSPLDIATELKIKTGDVRIFKLLHPEENLKKTSETDLDNPIKSDDPTVNTQKNQKIQAIQRLYQIFETIIHEEIEKEKRNRIYEERLEQAYTHLNKKSLTPFTPITAEINLISVERFLENEKSVQTVIKKIRSSNINDNLNKALLLVHPDKLNPILDALDLSPEIRKETEKKAEISYSLILKLKESYQTTITLNPF